MQIVGSSSFALINCTKSSLKRPGRKGFSSRRSIICTSAQLSDSWFFGNFCNDPHCNASKLGVGEIKTQGTPARRALSMATSRACQVGIRSSWRVSSCSSNINIAANLRTGANTADRVPTTTPPAAASAH